MNPMLVEPFDQVAGRAKRLGILALFALVGATFAAAPAAAPDAAPSGPAPDLLKAPFDDAAAKRGQADWARRLRREVVEKNSIGMKLTLIPAGEFMMGTAESTRRLLRAFPYADKAMFDDERPRHRVRITRSFYLGTSNVTVGQFRQFVAATNYRTDAEKSATGGQGYDPAFQKGFRFDPKFNWRNPGFPQTDDFPVVNVSWNDAAAFCVWLSKKEENTCRLPTEAEWEYACRAGTITLYCNGDEPEDLAKVGNVSDASAKAKFPWWTGCIQANDGYVFASPVGRFQPNPFGLFDLHGNVQTWCADWYGEKYYMLSPVDDPKGPSDGTERVVRGGDWDSNSASCRSAHRDCNVPANRSLFTGFRVVAER